jgi:hypothetical protein
VRVSVYPSVGEDDSGAVFESGHEKARAAETDADSHRAKGVEFCLLCFAAHIFASSKTRCAFFVLKLARALAIVTDDLSFSIVESQ